MESRHKNVLIGALLAVVFVMAVGYAAFAQTLTINGTADITSRWDVKITNIQVQGTPSGTASNYATIPAGKEGAGDTNPTYTDTTATFYASLMSPGDEITYDVTITNAGTIPAKVKTIGWDSASAAVVNVSPILYSFTGLAQNNVVSATSGSNTAHVYVTVQYDPAVTQQPTTDQLEKSATLVIEFEQAS